MNSRMPSKARSMKWLSVVTPLPYITVQRVELLLGGGRAALDSLAGLEVGLAARERTAKTTRQHLLQPDNFHART